jgi:selenocysteine lyase/cysteine desulfurase
LVVRI